MNAMTQGLQCASESFVRLHQNVARTGYRGYEFDDFLASPVLGALSRKSLLAQRVFIQAGELFPVNVRPLLLIPRLESTKARGFFARGYLLYYLWKRDPQWLSFAEACLDWLLTHSSAGYRGLCWGNAFDFASRGGFMPAGLPTVVWTAHIAEAFELGYQVTGKEVYLDAVRRAAEFVLSLPRHEDANGCCIGYTPAPDKSNLIHNSNLLGAATLLRSWHRFGGDSALAIARDAYRWTLSHMNADGSWYYGVGPRWHWIDNFHTAYNIDCLLSGHSLGDEQIVPWSVVSKAVRFWLDNFFLPDGTPKYYHDSVYPLDIQCAAQAIETASRLRSDFPDAGGVADRVMAWTVGHMKKRNGAFLYQRRKYWVNRLESIHWGQSTMLSALGAYVRSCGQKADVSGQPQRGDRMAPELVSP